MTENKIPEGHRKRASGCLELDLATSIKPTGFNVNMYSMGERTCYDNGGFRKVRRATETLETSKGKPLYEISDEDDCPHNFGRSSPGHAYSNIRRKNSRRSSAFTPRNFWNENIAEEGPLGAGAGMPDYGLTSIPSSSELLPHLNSYQSWTLDDVAYGGNMKPEMKYVDITYVPYEMQTSVKSEDNMGLSGEGDIRKGAWTTHEDNMLIQYCGNEEIKNWTEIAGHIPGRTAKQCRERWCFNLDPTINKEVWSPSEDLLLVRKQKEIGNKWAQIATLLPGRTENAVKTRYKSIVRAQKREWKPTEDRLLLSLYQKIGPNWEVIAKDMEPHRTKHAVKMRFKELQIGLIHVKLPEYGSAKQTVRESYYPQSTIYQISEQYKRIAGEVAPSPVLFPQRPLPRIPSFQRTGFANFNYGLKPEAELSFDQTFDDFFRVMYNEEEPLVLA